MGVHGLWKLLEPSGKPVPLETLENKVLAVDMSIWLHQLVKGYQDSRGNPVPNAHLLGLFHRVCKLLFYKIKPVFVFDGGVPQLKKQTIAARQQRKSKAERQADKVRELLIKNLAKHKALKHVLGDKGSNSSLNTSPQKKQPDMFELPVRIEDSIEDSSSSSEDDGYAQQGWKVADLHAVDVNSEQFKSLPADVRHDILNELKETRKQSSWGKLHEMPKESGDFSNYQMARLLKRRSIQVSLEETEKEMGGRSLSLGELQEMLTDQGVVAGMDVSKRIASDNVTRYLYLKEAAKQSTEEKIKKSNVTEISENIPNTQESTVFQLETNSSVSKKHENESTTFHLETDSSVSKKNEKDETFDLLEFLEKGKDSEDDLSSSDSEHLTSTASKLQMARDFIYENSGLTQEQILDLIKQQNISQETKHMQVRPSTSMENILPTVSDSKSEKINEVKEAIKLTDVQMLLKDANKVDHKESSFVNKELKTSTQHVPVSTELPETVLQRATNAEITEVLAVNRNAEEKLGCSKNKRSLQNETEECTNTAEELALSSTRSNADKNNMELFMQLSTANSDTIKISSSAENAQMPMPPSADRETEPNKNVNSSGDESSDGSFVEVRDIAKDKVLEVVINPKDDCKDDIFADIFSNETCVNKNTEDCRLENRNTNENKSLENFTQSKEPKATISSPPKEVEEHVSSPISEVPLHQERRNEYDSTKGLAVQKSTEELQQLQVDIEQEQKQLLAEKGKQDRLAATISQQMQLEAQELLRLFGIPYIIAPMEAEAQCAFLDAASLTEGTITDDSDIWLFGGRRVYKNFFNQKKYVLQFTISQIQHCFKLSRHELVLLALLVGSDYTPGIQGIGPVTALEILAAFSDAEDPLQILIRFQDWWKAGMPVGTGRTSLKSKLQGIQLTEGFPSTAVVNAYLQPEVDDSKETFSWGIPNLESLREYTRQKFGWTKSRTDEIILPIINKLSKKEAQMSLDAYFKAVPKICAAESKLSKRVQKAVQQMGGKIADEGESEEVSKERKEKCSSTSNKRKKEHVSSKTVSKKSRQKQSQKNDVQNIRATTSRTDMAHSSSSDFIPQRERDRLNALKSKLKAIEVFRTTHIDHTSRSKKKRKVIVKDANLSESSSDD